MWEKVAEGMSVVDKCMGLLFLKMNIFVEDILGRIFLDYLICDL